MSAALVDLARGIATVAHGSQTDKAGRPYIDHPARVVEYLMAEGASTEALAAGWLHDVLEDTATTAKELEAAGIPASVISLVHVLTHRPNELLVEYYARIVLNSVACAVKIADIRDNADPRRLAALDDPSIAHLVRKYARALVALDGAHYLSA